MVGFLVADAAAVAVVVVVIAVTAVVAVVAAVKVTVSEATFSNFLKCAPCSVYCQGQIKWTGVKLLLLDHGFESFRGSETSQGSESLTWINFNDNYT